MSRAAIVGVFVAVCLAVLGGLILRVEDLRLFGPDPMRVDVMFDSVTGLDDRAAVRVAGVRVGRVDGIGLDGRRARVSLLLDEPLELREGAYASVANVGLLGEKYVELSLGDPAGALLAEGAVLEGEVAVSWDQAMAKITEIGDSVLSLTGDLTEGDAGGNLGRLLDNLAAMSAELRDLVASNRGQVDSTIASFEQFSATLASELPRITRQMSSALEQIEAVIAENRDDFGEGLDNIRQLTASFQTSVDNLNQITGTLAAGEGSLGKLLNDDAAHDSLVSTLDSLKGGVEELRGTLGRIEKIQLDLGFEAYYLEDQEDTRTAFKLNIDPQSSRFYRIEAVDDPRGREKTSTEFITTTVGDGPPVREVIETRRITEDILISAQLGFTLGDFALRGGLIESTGGAGVDWMRETSELGRFTLSLEGFDFGREVMGEELGPRLRLSTKWWPRDGIYLIGGYDDLLESDYGSAFLGVGISWRDDDLKYLLGSVPTNF
ncbi:MAG: MCE family protein [Acidobacteria bacterium]|nr:MAG: MCE family protein [Acidobacteriota bacterium]REK08370.1 MAG: MCE family protein [Acidobacteriota bacterium]